MRAFCGFAIAVIAATCNRSPTSERAEVAVTAPADAIWLEREVLSNDTTLGVPTRVYTLDDSSIAVVSASEPFIHVLDRTSGRVRTSFGRRGQGSAQFVGVRALGNVGAGGFWAYDVTGQKLVRRTQVGGLDSVVPVPNARIFEMPLALNRGRFIAFAPSESSRILAFGPDLTNVEARGTALRATNRVDIPEETQARSVGGARVCFNRRRGLIALAYVNMNRLDVIDTGGADVWTSTAADTNRFEPVFTTDARGYGYSSGLRGSRVGYVSCSGSDDRLYALYSGNVIAEPAPGAAGMGSLVVVFGWDGAVLGRYWLHEPTFGIALDRSGNALLAVRTFPTPAVLRYQLPPRQE